MKWLAVIATAFLALGLLYLSRFWIFDLWGRPGLFGWDVLRPQGGLLGQWLRGTALRPFELLIWAIGGFALLSALQRLVDAMRNGGD